MKRHVRLLFCVAVLYGLWCNPARAETSELPAVADTYIDSTQPTAWIQCGLDIMFIGWGDARGGSIYRGVIKFDLAGIPSGAVVTSARLRLHITGSSGPEEPGAVDLSIRRITKSWVDWTGTWNNLQNASADHVYDTQTVSVPRPTVEWDVTGLVQEWQAGAFANYGLMIVGPETAPKRFWVFGTMEEEPNRQPLLIVEWSGPTATPTRTATATRTPTPSRTPTVTPTGTATHTPSAWVYLPLLVRP